MGNEALIDPVLSEEDTYAEAVKLGHRARNSFSDADIGVVLKYYVVIPYGMSPKLATIQHGFLEGFASGRSAHMLPTAYDNAGQ